MGRGCARHCLLSAAPRSPLDTNAPLPVLTWCSYCFPSPQLPWKKLREGTYNGAAYDVFKATFPTPCFGKIFDALPEESRAASALWIRPRLPAGEAACMVHLAATGDHGFTRRAHLGLPLVEQVCVHTMGGSAGMGKRGGRGEGM